MNYKTEKTAFKDYLCAIYLVLVLILVIFIGNTTFVEENSFGINSSQEELITSIDALKDSVK